METRAPYVIVGSFVLILIAGLVAAALWFAHAQFTQNVAYYDIYISGSVYGLANGSTVRLNGVPVGRVSEIRIDPSDPTKVRVTVELQPGLPIKTDTIASLELQGLAGGVYINITGGTKDAPRLEAKGDQRYPVIASRPSELQRVVSAAPEILARTLALTDQLNDLLNDQNRKAFAETIENLRKVSAVAANRAPDIDKALGSGAQSLKELHTALTNANAILTAMKPLVAPRGEMDATLHSIGDAAREYSQLAQHLDSVVGENQPAVRDFAKNGLPALQQLLAETQRLVVQLSRIADAIDRDPARLLYGDRREGYSPK
jgi:phospholipid/cholesterol/gamma-HCH transport system substrate-binding protein